MKKTFTLLSILAVLASSAQIKRIPKLYIQESNPIEKTTNPTAEIQTVKGKMLCLGQYVPGGSSTLTLNFSLTNTDGEYGDSLAISLPAGFTINSATPNDSIGFSEAPTTALSGCTTNAGGTKEPFRGIFNSNIAVWGNNDDCYGGLSTGTTYTVKLNITTITGLTGIQTGTYFISGDKFATTSADFSGTFSILPAGTPDLNCAFTTASGIVSSNNCGLGTLPVGGRFINRSTVAAMHVPVSYSINGGAAVNDTIHSQINAGDSLDFFFSTAVNFSGNNTFKLKMWSKLSGDGFLVNDTANMFIVNSITTPLSTTTYVNTIESGYDYSSLKMEPIVGPVKFGLSGTAHAGTKALFYTANTTNSPMGTVKSAVGMPCADVVSGETYKLSYWTRTNTSNNGGASVAVNSVQNASTANQIKPFVPNTANSTWVKDSVNYTATTTGITYFFLIAEGTIANGGTPVNVRFDDINIINITPNGIVKNATITGINVFPNPTSGLVTITVANTASVEVYNLVGEKIAAKNITSSGSVDLSTFASGAYYVKVISNEGTVTKKVILNK